MKSGIIVGAGASGLMAAIAAAERGASVTLLEHMPRAGKKILATGNGKCNLTNTFLEPSCYHCKAGDFPMEAIRRFPPEEVLRFFRQLGVLTTDRGGYVYPNSGQARTVLDALLGRVQALGVRLITEAEILSLSGREGAFSARTTQGDFTGEFLILAAGSRAARSSGSDGSGYALAQQFGHHVETPLPALVQLRCRGSFFPSVAGVRTEAAVSLWSRGKLLAEDRGELQLTDYGLSGIPVFQVSRYAARALDKKLPVSAVLDFFPQLEQHECFAMLRDQKRYLADRPAGEFLAGLLNKKLADLLLRQADIPFSLPVREFTKAHLSALCQLLKTFEVPVTAVNSYEQAQICVGGVRTSEVCPSTMESKKVPGLYLVGELLDVDGICGGYNLQWAWSSGHLAGCCAAEKGN